MSKENNNNWLNAHYFLRKASNMDWWHIVDMNTDADLCSAKYDPEHFVQHSPFDKVGYYHLCDSCRQKLLEKLLNSVINHVENSTGGRKGEHEEALIRDLEQIVLLPNGYYAAEWTNDE